MVASVHVLHASPSEIGGFLRIGHTGHRKLEALLAANRLYFRRFVFDASHIAEQTELVKSLRARGCEIVLDPNSAEMAALGRFNSSVSKLPWGNPDRPWQPSDFGKGRNVDTAKAIAEFAMRYSVDNAGIEKRLVNPRDALGDLHATHSGATRSSTPTFRGNFINSGSAAGGQRK
jgi:hypothetical protein